MVNETTEEIDNICYHVFDSIFRNDLATLQTSLKIYPDALEYMDRFSNTPLLYASYCGRSCLVRYLFSLGANHHRINIFGKYTQLVKKIHTTQLT